MLARLAFILVLSACRPSCLKTIQCYVIGAQPQVLEWHTYSCFDARVFPVDALTCEYAVTEEYEECW